MTDDMREPAESAAEDAVPIEEYFDWNDAWKARQLRRRHADDVEFWNGRAPSFAKTAGTSPYAREFLQRAGIEAGQTVFDMGCGSGTLALPLAQQGIEVWACDFSPKMIELMMKRAELEGTAGLIHPISLSWAEDWSVRELPTCDVAFASRSVATSDLRSALEKLDGQARERVCMTLGTDLSPRCDEVLLRAAGRPPEPYTDYVYGMNILWQMGRQPSLSYIRSQRSGTFASPEEALEQTCRAMEATAAERERLEAYTREHIVRDVDKHGEPCWRYDHTRVTSWAFISWDTRS